jgi:hypothetical protein
MFESPGGWWRSGKEHDENDDLLLSPNKNIWRKIASGWCINLKLDRAPSPRHAALSLHTIGAVVVVRCPSVVKLLFCHFLTLYTLNTALDVHYMLFQCPKSLFADKKPIISGFPFFWRSSLRVTLPVRNFKMWQSGISRCGWLVHLWTWELVPAGRYPKPTNGGKMTVSETVCRSSRTW